MPDPSGMPGPDRTLRGLVSIALAMAMLAVGAMAGGIFPAKTAYVMPLFVFSAAIFMADGAVTFTRMQRNQAELDRERDRLAAPWRVAFALAFLLALVSAARTGPSFITTTAVVLAVAAATIYLYRRRFFAILKETASFSGGSSRSTTSAPSVGVVVPAPVTVTRRRRLWLGLVALTLNTIGYQAEVLRGGFQSVGQGQVDAGKAIGMKGHHSEAL